MPTLSGPVGGGAAAEAKGTASFRFDNQQELLSFMNSLGPRAKMIQRGDAYYRAKQKSVF